MKFCFSVVSLFFVVSLASPAGTQPNILVLFADDLGYGDLNSYGHPTTFTPNIDALAASGIKFTQWYSGFHVCSPSRGSMMTGRIPFRIGLAGPAWTGGVFNADAVGGLPQNETTIAEALSGAGYKTHAVGKWHLGQQPQYLPTSHGFDSYYGIPYSDDMGHSAWRRDSSSDQPPLPLIQSTSPGEVDVIEQPTDLNKLSERYVKSSVNFITSASASASPWLLYMAFNHVHTPDFASRAFCNTSRRGLFGDALQELDNAVGEIVAAVETAGEAENTIIFFTSDNGPWLIQRLAGGSAGLLRDGKTTTWEGGVREPGIVSWKGKITPGRVEASVVTTYDIFPTALALAGVPLPTDRIYDGVDMSPILFKPPGSFQEVVNPDRCIFHYKGSPGLKCPKEHPDCPGLWAVRCGSYKWHQVTSNWTTGSNNGKFHDPPLIYHIEHDPSENFPLDPSSQEYQQARAVIEAAVSVHQKEMKPVPNQMAKGTDPNLRVCCNARSQMFYPLLPNCTCNPENYDVFVCTD